MSVFEHQSHHDHETVAFFHDPKTQLKAIIAIHNTTLGPAVGGCRMWKYDNEQQAIDDVLRLSQGMTYKNAIAGLPFGGGKSVIIDNGHIQDKVALFHAFGEAIETLKGRYYSAEDIGTSTTDIENAHSKTQYVFGLEGKSGDPSPFTALGVFLGMQSALQHQRQDTSLKNIRVSVQGVGHVGYYLCKHLHENGAKLVVSDINQDALKRVKEEFNATVVAPDDIYQQDVDIFAPCAFGGVINEQTLPSIKASIIAGSANNQLSEEHIGKELQTNNILYAPDYVINAGGIINVSFEKNYDKEKSIKKVHGIATQLDKIFKLSESSSKPTSMIANELAQQIINNH